MSKSPQTLPYEPPELLELGMTHELTQTCEKVWGPTDGFTFAGQGLATTSCTP